MTSTLLNVTTEATIVIVKATSETDPTTIVQNPALFVKLVVKVVTPFKFHKYDMWLPQMSSVSVVHRREIVYFASSLIDAF